MQAIPFVPPPGPVLHLLRAAGFSAAPPDIRNSALIPPAEYAAMLPAWNYCQFPPVDVRLHQLEDVTLASEGLVFLPDLDLVEASVTQHEPEEVEAARAAIAAAVDPPTLDGPHVLCVKRGATNYGHWLAEMLPMALLANKLLGREVRFLVPPHGGRLGNVIEASLDMAGIGADRIVRLDAAPCRINELVMVQGLSLHGLYLSPMVADLLQELAEPVVPSHRGCRLWVSRVEEPRSLWGEADLGRILGTLGWQVVNPSRLPFVDQVALFKGATQFAGVMGAGLANLLFAPSGARVDILAPAGMPDTFFYLISRLRALHYRETRCFQTRQAFGPAPWDTGLIEDLPTLLKHLG